MWRTKENSGGSGVYLLDMWYYQISPARTERKFYDKLEEEEEDTNPKRKAKNKPCASEKSKKPKTK